MRAAAMYEARCRVALHDYHERGRAKAGGLSVPYGCTCRCLDKVVKVDDV
jgi:hypothetical protein